MLFHFLVLPTFYKLNSISHSFSTPYYSEFDRQLEITNLAILDIL